MTPDRRFLKAELKHVREDLRKHGTRSLEWAEKLRRYEAELLKQLEETTE